jgi:hypothetical protein
VNDDQYDSGKFCGLQWAEVCEDGDPLEGYGLNLSSLNDSGMSLEDIAEIIEKEL